MLDNPETLSLQVPQVQQMLNKSADLSSEEIVERFTRVFGRDSGTIHESLRQREMTAEGHRALFGQLNPQAKTIHLLQSPRARRKVRVKV